MIVIFLFVSTLAQAEPGYIHSGRVIRFDTISSGSGLIRHLPYRIGGGYWVHPTFSFAVDLSWYNYGSDNNGVLDSDTEHYELIGLMRASIWDQPSWNPYGLLGLGLQKKIVTTSFAGESSRDEGRFEFVSTIGFGVMNKVVKNFGLGFEGRGYYRPRGSPKYSLDFLFSLVFYLP